MNWCSQPITA